MLTTTVLLTVALAAFSGAGNPSDEGLIHTGVGSEAEAEAFPCAPTSTGPVVCVPDRGTAWRLSSDASGQCVQGPAGWQGDCVRAFDAGDHLRVWGTRGVPPRTFRITWSTASRPDDDGPPAATTDRRQSSGSRGEAPEPQPAPRVATSGSTGGSTTVRGADPAPLSVDAASAAGSAEIPEGVFWDPPLHEVPGYSDLVAAPGPTYPHVPAGLRGRGDAGAPAAAGTVALLAAAWVILERRRDRPTEPVG